MGQRIDRIRVRPKHTFTADGEAIPCADLGLAVVQTGGAIVEIRLTFSLDPQAWSRVDANGWFRLAPDRRGPSMVDFDPDRPVHIECRLTPELLPDLVAAGDMFDIGGAIVTAGPESPLASERSWPALYVSQATADDPDAKLGFATVEADLAR